MNTPIDHVIDNVLEMERDLYEMIPILYAFPMTNPTVDQVDAIRKKIVEMHVELIHLDNVRQRRKSWVPRIGAFRR